MQVIRQSMPGCVELMVLLPTHEIELIFFKTNNLYFGVKSQKIEFF